MFPRIASSPLKADPRKVAWGILASLAALTAAHQWAGIATEAASAEARNVHAGEVIAASISRQIRDFEIAIEGFSHLPHGAGSGLALHALSSAASDADFALGVLPSIHSGQDGAEASESTRIAAQQKARDTGGTTIVWPTAASPLSSTPAVAMYRAVYAGNTLPASVAERRQRLIGFVYARLPLYAMIGAAITPDKAPPLRLRIYDHTDAAPASLLLDARLHPVGPAVTLQTARLELPLPGRNWALELDAPRADASSILPLLATAGVGLLALVALVRGRASGQPVQDDPTAAGPSIAAVPPQPATSREHRDRSDETDTMNRFFGAVSADVRTTLQTVALTSHLCLDEATTPRQRHALEKALAEGDQIVETLDSVRHFFALESGEVTPVIADVNLRAVILEVAEATETRLHDKPVTVEWLIADDVPAHVRTDRDLLQATLRQLAMNAIATTLGGTITFSCSLSRWQGADMFLHFCVVSGDTAPQDATYRQLIDELQRSNHLPSGLRPGPALRFVVAVRQVALMGGELWTSADHGAVHFTLPVTVSPLHEQAPPRLPAASAARERGDIWQVAGAPLGAKVLLVEDNSINRYVATEMLERMGIQVSEATNGVEALQALNSVEFDLVLMDVRMPVMGGCETTRLIRTDPRHRQLPVVAITANTSEAIQEECIRSGMNDFITKPIDPACLSALLSRHLARPAPEPSDLGLAA